MKPAISKTQSSLRERAHEDVEGNAGRGEAGHPGAAAGRTQEAARRGRTPGGGRLVGADVRDPDEYRDGSIEAATNISRGFLEFRVGTVAPEPSTPIVLYCQTGL